MKIIECSLLNVDCVAPLFDAYRQFYDQPLDLIGAANFLKERIIKNESVIFAAVDETGAGLGFTQLYPIFSSVSMKRVWLLNDLFVTPQARRRGVAEALMARARQLAEETHAKGILLETGTDNSQAQALYEKLGYVRNEETFFYFLKV